MHPVLNISTYRFVPLHDLAALRERLETSAAAAGLLGTVLIAHEGINLFVAGAPAAVRGWVAGTLHADPRFAGLAAKESFSEATPFKRLKVKIKDEIIRMNHPAIRPQETRAPSVDAPTLARWLAQGHDDAGREVALLDTRNAFEVDAGTFEGAHDWRLEKFSDFPAAFDARRTALEGKTVVSFCTGGIRCEKAALYMRERDMPGVLQLEDGILGYFAATGGAAPGWQGRCFVFDERRTVEADLAPGGPENAASGATLSSGDDDRQLPRALPPACVAPDVGDGVRTTMSGITDSTSNVHRSTSNVHRSTSKVHQCTSEVHHSTLDVDCCTSNVDRSTWKVEERTVAVHDSTFKVDERTVEVHPSTLDVHECTSMVHSSTSDDHCATTRPPFDQQAVGNARESRVDVPGVRP